MNTIKLIKEARQAIKKFAEIVDEVDVAGGITISIKNGPIKAMGKEVIFECSSVLIIKGILELSRQALENSHQSREALALIDLKELKELLNED